MELNNKVLGYYISFSKKKKENRLYKYLHPKKIIHKIKTGLEKDANKSDKYYKKDKTYLLKASVYHSVPYAYLLSKEGPGITSKTVESEAAGLGGIAGLAIGTTVGGSIGAPVGYVAGRMAGTVPGVILSKELASKMNAKKKALKVKLKKKGVKK